MDNGLVLNSNSGNDSRPLPLLVAEHWHFNLHYVYEDNICWYSITDWMAGLTKTKYPGDRWGKLRRTSDMQPILAQIRTFPYGTGTSQFIDDKGLYRITLNLRATKNRTALPEIKA